MASVKVVPLGDPYLTQVLANLQEDRIRVKWLGTTILPDNSRIYRFKEDEKVIRYYVNIREDSITSLRRITSSERKKIGRRLKAKARRKSK